MRLLSSVAAVAVLALTTPAFAAGQTPTPAPQAPQAPAAAAEAPSPEEVAINERAQAFSGQVQAMATEMQAAASQADKAKAKTDLDAIQARHQPEIDRFAEAVQTFATAKGEPADEIAVAIQEIKALPATIRAKIEEAAAAAPAQPQ